MTDPVLKADAIVAKTLNNLAASPNINLSEADAADIKPAVVDEISKVITYQTNQEPFYQSTVTIGAIITLIGGGYTFIYEIATNGAPEPTAFVAAITPIVGALVTLYGRWIQRKPIGA